MWPVAQDAQSPLADERRFLAISEACRGQEHAAADQLLHAPRNVPHPAYMRLVDAYQAIRIECTEKWLAVLVHRKGARMSHRKTIREERIDKTVTLQAHALSRTATLKVHAPHK